MTGGLLASVRDADEARAALAGGAAVIDVKEPRRGALGCADPAVAAAVAGAIGDAAPWTAALGELSDGVDAVGDRLRSLTAALGGAPAPVAVKVGLAAMADRLWERALEAVFAGVPAGVESVAVAYADHAAVAAPDPLAVIAIGRRLGCRWVLFDTFTKGQGSVLHGRLAGPLAGWVAAARCEGLEVALAGSLTLDDVPAALGLGARLVGMRTALCCGGRYGSVDREFVRTAVAAVVAARRDGMAAVVEVQT